MVLDQHQERVKRFGGERNRLSVFEELLLGRVQSEGTKLEATLTFLRHTEAKKNFKNL
jgi:hypothetical protein